MRAITTQSSKHSQSSQVARASSKTDDMRLRALDVSPPQTSHSNASEQAAELEPVAVGSHRNAFIEEWVSRTVLDDPEVYSYGDAQAFSTPTHEPSSDLSKRTTVSSGRTGVPRPGGIARPTGMWNNFAKKERENQRNLQILLSNMMLDEPATKQDSQLPVHRVDRPPNGEKEFDSLSNGLSLRMCEDVLESGSMSAQVSAEPATAVKEARRPSANSTDLSKSSETCSVCLEVVTEKSDPRFGILLNCDHVFCISCIRDWRSQLATDRQHETDFIKCCPLCRQVSYFVVPSLASPSQINKPEVVATYHAKLKQMRCKYFDHKQLAEGKLDSCPFGSSCFYGHFDELGNEIGSTQQNLHKLQTRTFRDAEGAMMLDSNPSLFDYLKPS